MKQDRKVFAENKMYVLGQSVWMVKVFGRHHYSLERTWYLPLSDTLSLSSSRREREKEKEQPIIRLAHCELVSFLPNFKARIEKRERARKS